MGFGFLSLNNNQVKHERRREEEGDSLYSPWLWEHQLWGCASVWQLNGALGSELIPRKSKEFGALKAGAGKGDLWSVRLPKENRVVRRELSLTTIKGESVLGRTHLGMV